MRRTVCGRESFGAVRPRRPERGRGAFAMAAGMLALFALACGPPARAEVLVSNIGQNGDGRSPLINTSTPTLSALFHAQGFTTGNNDAGYTLTSIDIYFHNTEDGTTPTVTLHEGSPTGTLVDTLTGPANVSESETFTASSNIILDPRTSYFVVLQPNSASGVFLSVTDSDNEDATGETDWRIDDLGHYQYIQPILQPYLEWLQAKRIRVNGEIIPTNTAPTSSPGTVQATEDTAYTFAASDFNFSDADTGDTLSSVKVETLPANGSLTLSGAAVSANATVTKAQLDNGDLKYTPPADGYGDSYASFMFKVNDGTVDSASAYTMTINVMNVNDAPTGAPAIVGEPKAGVTLSLDFSGVADADGLPAVMDMEFTWAHTDNASVRLGTESTYLLSARDVGKNIYVYVEYTDAGGTAKESIEISSWPATGAIVANAAPTASPSRVDVTEDMAYTFTASDFSFSDADTGDTLSSVKIETLPLIGSLTLSGAAVSANSTVTRAQLDNGELKYTPAADGYGVPMNNFLYASFRFSVNDGTADSAIEYPMDINIMNVNDPPTGALAIVGEPKAGVTLSLDFSGVVDADGLPAVMTMLFRWAHTDNDQLGLGNQSTYLLSARDVGKNIKVFVEYEDMGSGKESIETSSWPATGTIVANATPTASNGTVDVTEDMAYTFAASDFNFSDADTGDTLSSVKVETLPLIGSLTLSGAAVSAMDTVTKAQLDNGELKYTPAADGYGNPYASFMFKVNDGAVDSADAYTMTINVTNVNDAPTGAPAIVGEPEVGVTLSLDFSGVVDADGLPAVTAMDITWFHTDNPQRMIGTGSTYALVASDLGKNLYVYVEYTDLGGTQKESLEISSWPATGTIVDNTNADPTVANEIPDQEAVAGMSFSYQFPANTFNDADTSDTLGYEATKADGFELPTWLSFDAATRTFSGTPASTDTGTVSVKVLATDSSNGAISDQFDITVVPALTLSFEDFNNSDLVEGNSLDVPVLLSGAPGREVTITLFADPNRGLSGSDYTTSSLGLTFGASETRKVVTVTATDDSEVDPGERLLLALPAAADLPTGILPPSRGDIKIIQIVDNDFQYQASHAGGTTLAVNEQAGTLTATVRVEAPNVSKIELDALNENVVLSVSTADGTATAGQDYTLLSQTLTFAPSDFAAQTSGCPPPTPLFCMRADKTVTLAITDDTAYEGATAETFTLTLSHETDQRVTYPSPAGETATVSIADDERPALTFTVAPTTILENAGTATVTLATTGGAGITADTAIALSLAGTATKGTDYTISSESLTLTAGQSSVTATITATMDTASDDNETVVVTASSGGTAIGTAQTVTITETMANSAPVLDNAIPDQSAVAGTAFSYQVPADAFSDPDDDTLAYAANKADDTMLPTWLSFDAATRTFTGTPASTDTGTVSVKVTATDTSSATVSDEFDIVVIPAAPAGFTAEAGDGRVRLSWTEPRPRVVHEYRYAAGASVPANAAWTSIGFSDQSTVLISGLTNGTAHAFEVRVVGSGGVGPGAAAAVSATPSVAACSAPNLGGRRSVWSATLTVGPTTFSSDAIYAGYENRQGNTPYGSLSPSADFSIGGTSYTIASLETVVTNSNRRSIFLELVDSRTFPEAVRAALQFHWCGDSSGLDTLNQDYRVTDDNDADWSIHTTREVALSLPANNDATGTPTVTGTAQAGETLTAGMGNITDADGLPATFPGDYAFQWVRVDADGTSNATDITNATANAYTLTAADVGKRVRVRVSFFDVLGGDEEIPGALSDVVVSAAAPNSAPTSSPGKADVTEDMVYTFAASDFSFSDTDTGDTLSSVKVETLPALGSLTLSDAAVSAMDTVTKAQLDNGELKYTPAADGYGDTYASFMFEVSDGAAESTGDYTMTINVLNVNDPPTGALAIVGDPTVGVTLSLDFSGVVEADGLPAVTAMEIRWFHTDNEQGMISTESTYLLIASDVGKNIKVRVEYDDLGGTQKESIETASWPATGTIVANTNNEPTVANEIPDQEAVAGMSFSYQFPANTFNDADDDTLTYRANKADDASMLPTWLSFDAATRTFSGTPASTDLGTVSVQVTADDSNGGTNNDIFDITVVPALTVSFVDADFHVVEGNSVDVPLLLSGAPGREVTITLIAALRDGLSSSDYMVSSLILTFGAAETRKVVTVTATDDSEVDPGEDLLLSLPSDPDLYPTGILPGFIGTRTIQFSDNDFQYQASHAGGTTLSVNEQAGTLTATVRVEAPNVSKGDLGALNENVVLRVSTADGTATAGQDYTLLSQTLTFAPADFTPERSGCPPPNPAFCARADKTVTVAITDDTAYEGATAETFTLTLSHETDQRVTYPSPTGETATVSIADDERPALTFTVAPTTILENAGTATVTLATTDGTGITADQTIALSLAGTATKGTDYTISSESLTLTAGQSSVTATITATMDTASDDNETVVVTASSGGAAIGTAQTVTITETLPTPTLTIAVDPASIAEAAGTSTVTVSTGTPFTANQTIALTLGGTATEISDYTIGSTSLTLTAGEMSVTTTVTAVQDTIDEPDETVIVTAANGSTAIGSATVTITDDDDAPGTIVANAAPTSSPSEVDVTEDMVYTFAAADFSFSDTDTGDTLSSVKVETLPVLGSLTLSGAAVSAMDRVTKAQLDNGDLKYTPAADGYGDTYATFLFRVNDGTADSAIRYPMDIDVMNVNDAPTGALAIVGEPTVGVTLTLDFSGVMDADGLPDKFEINWFHTDNNNQSLGIGSTYELIASDVGKNIKVFVEYEDMGGGKESIETASWPATGTIVDSNNEPTVANEIPDQEAVAGTSFSYQVPADAFSDADDDTLTYTANKADDASTLPTWLSFDAATRTFSGTPATTDLGTDSVQVTASDNNGGTTNDIFDILVVPALGVTFEDSITSDLAEGNSLDVPVLLSGAPGREVTITLSAEPSRGLSSSDYSVSSLSLKFGASETRKVVTVTATDDSEVDPGERLLLALPAPADLPTGIQLSSGDLKIINIVDNDFQYQASHADGTTLSVNEQAGTLTATVRVEAPNTSKIELGVINENVVLSVSTADGTATAGQDYTLLSQTLTFAPADFAAQHSGCPPPSPNFCARADKTVTVAITDDTAYEGATAETFTLTLSHETDQRVTYPSPTGETATVSIADDERPALTFTVAPTTILENGGTATVTLATTDGTGITADTAIALSLAGTATKGTDYTISSESLTLTAGQSSVTATITATMDAASDDNETVVVTASSGGTAIGTAQTVTITETLPTLSIAVNPASIAEAAGTSTVTVSTGTPFTADQTISLTLGGTATETSDYTLSDTSLTLTAGETSVTTTVTAVQDTIDEPDETVIVSAGNGGTAIGSATVTITDDDDAPTLSVAVAPASIAEAAGTSTVTVSTGASTFATDQTIALTLSGTATETSDYTISSTSLTLTAGETSVTATVTAVQDTIDEPDETVIVSASNGGTAIGSATVTITDDDDAPTLSIAVAPASIAEAAGTSTVTVSTGTAFTADQTISLTLGGTATETSDYTLSDTSLTLTAGETSVTATVTAVQDTLDEPDETVIVSAGNGGTAIGSATVTITDDDDAPTLTPRRRAPPRP